MELVDEAKSRMDDAVGAIRREFGTVRTGKAVPSILDSVRVDAYGSRMPLNQVSTVSAPDPTMLVIQPFDPSLIGPIEKSVLTADLGLNPSNDGTIVRVPIPPLSEERRKQYVRLLNKMAEEGRVSVRRARQAANERVRARLRANEVGQDEAHRTMADVQKLTDDYIGKIDHLLTAKEKEVMAI